MASNIEPALAPAPEITSDISPSLAPATAVESDISPAPAPAPAPATVVASTPSEEEHTPRKFWCWDDTNSRFPPHRMFFLVCSFLFYLTDVGFDMWVAIEYYIADKEGTDVYAGHYLGATLFFIIVPCLVLNFVSWSLYTWGWLIYRNKKLNQFCYKRLEQMKYVEPSSDKTEVDTVVLVQGVHVINWSRQQGLAQNTRSLRSTIQSNPTHKRKELGAYPGATTTSTSSKTRDNFTLSILSDVVPINYSQEGNAGNVELGLYPGSPTTTNITTRRTRHKKDNLTVPILSDTDDNQTDSNNDNDETDIGLEFYPLDFFDLSEYLVVSLIHFCLLGYLFRVVRLLYMSRRDKFSFDRYRDISFLRLIESFLESAPQLVLQLYLLVVHHEAVLWYRIVTPLSILLSITSLALAVGDYISAAADVGHYDPHPNAQKTPRLSWLAYFTIIFWHFFMIIARGLAFSLFATVYGAYVFLIVGLHYLAMVYWMYWQHAHVFKQRHANSDERRLVCDPDRVSWKECVLPCQKSLCKNYGIEFIAAAFNVFFHFKIRDGGAVATLVPFYLLCFVENALMILLWYFGRDRRVRVWYGTPALVVVFIFFAVGIVLLVLYYLWCQPSQENLKAEGAMDYPTMTASLNRMYEIKEKRGNFFKRALGRNISN